MGARRGRFAAWTGAVLVAACLVGLGLYAQVVGISDYGRFRHWLEDQPGVASIERLGSDEKGSGQDTSGQVPHPTAAVTMSGPLTQHRVEVFMTAFEHYSTDHSEARFYTVELHHGADTVLAQAIATDNARILSALRAMRALPDLTAVAISIDPWPAHMTATLAPTADLVKAATSLAASTSTPGRSLYWRNAGLTVRASSPPHGITVRSTTPPSPLAARAFSEAVRLEGAHPVTLVVGREGTSAPTVELRLDEGSPTSARTRSAVNALGFGMTAHGEAVLLGPSERAQDFDAAAWSGRALPAVRAVPGVRSATLALEGDRAPGRSVLDVHVGTATDLTELAASVPDAVDVVRVHTAPTALDPDRDDALPEDLEQGCPAGPAGEVNTGYTGPAAQFAGAARLMALLAATGRPTCLHWELSARATPTEFPSLVVRVSSLRQRDWQPVLDAMVAQRTSGEGTPPRTAVLVPGTPEPWTAMLLLDPVQDEPYPSSAVAANPTEMRAAMAALAPLVRHWKASLGGR